MAKTYSNGGYSVTIQDDRSIRVQPNDWLSKYSMAIYGNFDHIAKFKRKIGDVYIEIDNKDLIDVGELLYHPDPLPDEFELPPECPVDTVPDGKLKPNRVAEYLNWLKDIIWPVNDWSFKGAGGAELSGAIFSGQYLTIRALKEGDPDFTWYHGIGPGLSLGLESAGGFSGGPVWAPGYGFIGKCVTAGTELSADEICGSYILMDFTFGYGVGVTPLAIMLFGMNFPPQFIVRNIARYLSGESFLYKPIVPMGCIVMGGTMLTTPNLGVAIKAGWLHRKECLPFVGSRLQNLTGQRRPTARPAYA